MVRFNDRARAGWGWVSPVLSVGLSFNAMAQSQNIHPPATWPSVPPAASGRQAVYWSSAENMPGETVLLSGTFSTSKKSVRLASLINAASATAAISASNLIVSAALQGSQGLSFQLPEDFPVGPFVYRLEEASSTDRLLGLGNVPTIKWVQGQYLTINSQNAPLHQIIPDGAERGGLLRIFGKNFPVQPKVVLTASDGTRRHLSSSSPTSSVEIAVRIPTYVAAGSYAVSVGMGDAVDATSGPGVPVGIRDASTMTTATVDCTGLVGDGTTDNTAALQGCIEGHPAAANQAMFIRIPADGRYKISSAIRLNPHQYLQGSDEGNAVIVCESVSPPDLWISGSSFFGLVRLTVEAVAKGSGYLSGVIGTDASNGGHAVIFGSSIVATAGHSQSAHVALSGPDIQILQSSITSENGSPFYVGAAEGVLVSGVTVSLGRNVNYVANTRDFVVENSVFTGTGETPGGLSVATSGSAYPFGPRVGNLENGYVHNVSVSSALDSDRQAITTDGDRVAYGGGIVGATDTSVTLANDFECPCGVAAMTLSVVGGKGIGQYRRVQSASGRTITLAEPWTVQPDASSQVAMNMTHRNLIFHNNNVTSASEGIQLFGQEFDSMVVGNRITDAAGIKIWSRQYTPNLNVDVYGNVLSGDSTPYNTSGQEKPYLNRIVLNNSPGVSDDSSLTSSVMVRDNIGNPTGFVSVFGNGAYGPIVIQNNNAPLLPGVFDLSLLRLQLQGYLGNVLSKDNEVVAANTAFGTPTNQMSAVSGALWAGMKFTTGARPLFATHLSRWVLLQNNGHPRNTGDHVVKLVDAATGADVPGAAVTVGTGAVSAAAASQDVWNEKFASVPLASALLLPPRKAFLLVSGETTSQDHWYSADFSQAVAANGKVLNGPVTGTLGSYMLATPPNATHGPVNLVFRREFQMANALLSTTAVRNDVSHWAGLQFTVGPFPIRVSSLARWVAGGNTGAHMVKLVDAETGLDVAGASVTVNTAGVAGGSFAYGVLPSLITLQPQGRYFLVSQETAGGDAWPDQSTMNANAGLTVDGHVVDGVLQLAPNKAAGALNMLFGF